MGGFELILVVIGVAWTIASGVMQKKAKAAKAARIKALAEESASPTDPTIPTEPMSERAAPKPLKRRLSELQQQIIEAMDPDAAGGNSGSQGPVAQTAIGQAVKVPQPRRPLPAAQPQQQSPVSSQLQEPATIDGEMPVDRSGASLRAEELSQLLADPTRIREAIVLSEILGPPVALRG